MASYDSLDTANYASARRLVREALDYLMPVGNVSVADYAAQHRRLANRGGGYVGRWRHDQVPYLVDPMDALTSRAHTTVAVIGPGQSAKTSIAENWLLQSVGADPANFLWYMQTEPALNAYVQDRIDGMIRDHDVLREKLGPRASDRSMHRKAWTAMQCQFLAATMANMISKSAPRIVVDEIDAYPDALGDVMALVNVRRQTFGRESKVLTVSHPDRAGGLAERHWNAGIMRVYRESDRRLWYWPCAVCGAWSSPNPAAPRAMALDYPEDGTLDEIEFDAKLVCPSNGCLIDDAMRRAMNARGRWIGLGQDIDEEGRVTGELVRRDVAGFWITGLMSPFVHGGIGGLARARVAAERDAEVTGDDRGVRQVVCKQFGIPYEPKRQLGTLDATAIADRAEAYPLREVPPGVRFLTVAIDAQADRFELLARGWGRGGESWIVDHRRVEADPATDPDAWDRVLRIAQAGYALGDGSGRVMRPRAVGFDSGGAPGTTQQAYDAWNRARARREARMLGKVGGRHAWSILPLKGMSGPNAPRLAVVYPDDTRKDRAAAARGAPLGQFNPGLFKDDLAGQLARAEPGPWTVHFPAGLRAEQPPHPFFEQLVAEKRLPSGRWEKIAAHARNEALDLMVMTHALARLHGIGRIDWDRPAAWAAEWDRNPLVVEASHPTTDAPAPPRASPPAPAPAWRPGMVSPRVTAPSRAPSPARLARRLA